jgi:hypothetical protein
MSWQCLTPLFLTLVTLIEAVTPLPLCAFFNTSLTRNDEGKPSSFQT